MEIIHHPISNRECTNAPATQTSSSSSSFISVLYFRNYVYFVRARLQYVRVFLEVLANDVQKYRLGSTRHDFANINWQIIDTHKRAVFLLAGLFRLQRQSYNQSGDGSVWWDPSVQPQRWCAFVEVNSTASNIRIDICIEVTRDFLCQNVVLHLWLINDRQSKAFLRKKVKNTYTSNGQQSHGGQENEEPQPHYSK